MTPVPVPGFQSLSTHHCVTGSLRHCYVHAGLPLSEEMLLGLGGGVGFSYWHFKGQTPFMGGRANIERPGVEGLEKTLGRRTGVGVQTFRTSSARKAERSLVELLDGGQPVMLQCDMGFLPYFDFGSLDYHFGWHVIVVCGYDPHRRQILVADRDEELHTISMDDLAKARGSKHKPFPPQNHWWVFDFTQIRNPSSLEIRAAISEQVNGMLAPPISNIGVKGIRKAAKRSVKWADQMDQESLRLTMFNAYIFIDAEGGTGGGIFRYMFSRFLSEGASLLVEPGLEESAAEFLAIGDRWQHVAALYRAGSSGANLAQSLADTSEALMEIADREEAAWNRLHTILTD